MKAVCEQGMVKHFRKDNIFEILILADRFNAPNLKVERPAIFFICICFYFSVFQSDVFYTIISFLV